MSGTPQDVRAIFTEAIGKETPQEQAAYLNAACGSDSRLRAEVESLVAAHRDAGPFLRILLEDPDPLGANHHSPLLTEGPGTVIGRYKLLEKIGEGGMAVVYMAEQTEPIRRKVALKIIKLGMDTRQVIARFEAERQALALMDHPSIAKVLDAGATETGRLYFVMELVQGVSITEYCDQNSLSTKDRLALFLQVCHAVQHAHQKGIIHRDIKPSNVMVTQRDGRSVPKVIDFGIAKATNQKLTEKTLFTRYAHLIGTPAYMSPEQAELSDLDIDTRSDIYSLGVLLYELLTGTTPFSEEELRKAGYIEMQRVIREQEPTKPSTKLTSLGEKLTEVAKHRGCTPDLLRRTIRGDLDWIVMKALEKDRARRYETANGLADDVRRHLESEPVLARGPSASYHLQKFVSRHRSQVLAALLMIVLAGTAVVTFSLWNRSRHELAEAESFRHANLLSEARAFYAKGQNASALALAKTLLPSRHVGIQAGLLYASLLTEGRQPDEALTVLETLVQEQPELAGAAHALWARILWENQSFGDEGRREIEDHQHQAEALLADTAEAYFLRAMTALTIKEKLTWLDKAIQKNRTHYDAYQLRAYTYYASRKYQRMEHDAIAMCVLKPANAEGYSLRAIALEKMERYTDALSYCDQALALTSKEAPEYIALWSQRCDLLMRLGDYERVIASAEEGFTLFPNETKPYFHMFCARTALGDYETAATCFHHVMRVIPAQAQWFKDWTMKYVFDRLDAGLSWHAPENKPGGVAFLPMLEAEQTYHHLRAKARRFITGGFLTDWCPDGSKVAFSLGLHGYSGLAVYDTTTQETELLIAPGKDPRWSPDGKTIAFVRDCRNLRLSTLTAAQRRTQHYEYKQEVWTIHADGTGPRRLAYGHWPFWSEDSQTIYYESDNTLYALPLTQGEARPEPVAECLTAFPSLSPDNERIAFADDGSLTIVDLASKTSVTHKTGPPTIWGGNWSPSGREFSLGGYFRTDDRTGLWIFDRETAQAAKVFSGQITCASWKPDGMALDFTLGPPYNEIWIADLDPHVPTTESLGPARTLEDHHREMVDHYSRVIENDPQDAVGFLHRALYLDYLDDKDAAFADMNQYVTLMTSSPNQPPQGAQILAFIAALSQGKAENLGPLINSPLNEISPRCSADGLSLFFASDCVGGFGNPDIWMATRMATDSPWSKPVNLGPPVNTRHWEGGLALFESDDGLSLFFTSDRPGGQGGSDIWLTTRSTPGGPWANPVNLGSPLNSPAADWGPSISSNGLELYFSSDRPNGHGGDDIYVTTRASTEDPWCEPVNIGPSVNSPQNDGSPSMSANGRLLFFKSSREGSFLGGDIWVTERPTVQDDWGPPVNLGPAVNNESRQTGPELSPDASVLYFSCDRDGGMGHMDIWQVSFNRPPGLVQTPHDTGLSTRSRSTMQGKEE
jgi:serine/threonine protein kinase/Tol biopolymer transport system component